MPIAPPEGPAGPANVSPSAIVQTGSGSPIGAVVPTGIGALYEDLTNGSLFVAIGATNAGWVALGGNVVHNSEPPGVGIDSKEQINTLDGTLLDSWSVYDKATDATGLYVQSAAKAGTANPRTSAGANLLDDGTATHGATFRIVAVNAADAAGKAPQLGQLSPLFTITSGALPTQQFVSGAAAQVSTAGDVEVHTPVTFNPGVATTATCKVELSPDNTTFSTLCTWTLPVGVAFDGTIKDVTCRVPAGWYLKLTVSATAVLGLSTYY